jgi:hypothetical protein
VKLLHPSLKNSSRNSPGRKCYPGGATARLIVFCFCGIAYLLAWSIIKSLVPKYKPIEL